MWLPLVLLSLLLIIATIIFNKRRSKLVYPTLPGPGSDSWFGTTLFIKNKPDTFTVDTLENSKKWPQIYQTKNLFFNVYWITDPDTIKDVMITRKDEFVNHPDFQARGIKKLLTSKALFTIRDAKWKERRNLLSPHFTTTKINPMVDIIARQCQVLCDIFEEKKDSEVDLKSMTGNLTLDVLCETVFGSLVGAQRDPNGTISKRVTDFMNGTGGLSWILFLPFWDKLPMGKVQRFLRGQEYLARVCKEVIQTRKNNGTRVNDLLQSLIDANLSEEDTLAEALLFLIAGHETTAIALTWAIYAISQNPEVEKKLVSEIDKVLQGKPPTQGNIHSLEYIEMIVDETLRMYPPGAVTSRDNSQEVNLLGHTFPPNTPFFLPIWAIHHNEKYWPEPEKFIPERFNKKNHINPAHYFPFGGGPRMCIGFRFSLTELKVALAMLYQKFTFEYPRQKHPEIGVDGFLKPIDLPIIAHLRQ